MGGGNTEPNGDHMGTTLTEGLYTQSSIAGMTMRAKAEFEKLGIQCFGLDLWHESTPRITEIDVKEHSTTFTVATFAVADEPGETQLTFPYGLEWLRQSA